MATDPLIFKDGALWMGGNPWTPSGPFLAVLGDPVSHSLSPVMQGAALEARGLDHAYLPLEVRKSELAALRRHAALDRLTGCNVTAPHKEQMAELCEGLTPTAARLGAVNTIRCEADGRWLGHNTDSGGLLMVLNAALGEDAGGQTAAVLGTGGAARAAVDALARWGVAMVTVYRNSAGSGSRFAAWAQGADLPCPVQVQPLAEAPEGVAGVWINALAREVDLSLLLPVTAPTEDTLLIDLRYGADLPGSELPLGFRGIDGLPLLVMQGGLSFAWWFGAPVPWAKMRAAIMTP